MVDGESDVARPVLAAAAHLRKFSHAGRAAAPVHLRPQIQFAARATASGEFAGETGSSGERPR